MGQIGPPLTLTVAKMVPVRRGQSYERVRDQQLFGYVSRLEMIGLTHFDLAPLLFRCDGLEILVLWNVRADASVADLSRADDLKREHYAMILAISW